MKHKIKKFLFIIPFLGILLYAYSANKPAEISKDGIIFFEGTWTEALKKSEAENKPIFLDVSTSWCGYCKKMKRNAFSDKEVGSYFNNTFINVAVDAEQGEGVAIAQKYNVTGYPTLIILDKNEKVILYAGGYLDTKDFLQMGKKAIEKSK